MIFISVFAILISSYIAINLHINNNRSKKLFQKKINSLENLILELNQNLMNQDQKVILSNKIKAKLKESNIKLSDSVLDLNYDLLDKLYNRK